MAGDSRLEELLKSKDAEIEALKQRIAYLEAQLPLQNHVKKEHRNHFSMSLKPSGTFKRPTTPHAASVTETNGSGANTTSASVTTSGSNAPKISGTREQPLEISDSEHGHEEAVNATRNESRRPSSPYEQTDLGIIDLTDSESEEVERRASAKSRKRARDAHSGPVSSTEDVKQEEDRVLSPTSRRKQRKLNHADDVSGEASTSDSQTKLESPEPACASKDHPLDRIKSRRLAKALKKVHKKEDVPNPPNKDRARDARNAKDEPLPLSLDEKHRVALAKLVNVSSFYLDVTVHH
ncbi:hypothetical protein C8Q78DRAFT_995085 [Trametes maxima]|nr:hypothetical protein C8Q78DRAFT_995085 [Trametes maxima]